MEFHRSVRPNYKINLISMIDVIFLLIIFFLMTSEFMTVGNIGLNVSAVSGDERIITPSPDGPILILLQDNSSFLLDNKKFNLAELRDKLEGLIARHQDREIVIKSSEGVSVQDVVSAMDQVRAAGGHNISLVQSAAAGGSN